jgi:hypothetical protein
LSAVAVATSENYVHAALEIVEQRSQVSVAESHCALRLGLERLVQDGCCTGD